MPKEHPKGKNAPLYSKAKQVLVADTARSIADKALASWHLPSEREALEALKLLDEKFPDDETPGEFWHNASSTQPI